MNYAEIKEYDIANGPGIRLSLFVSGCTHKCKGCFNEIAWDFSYGKEFTKETEEYILNALSDSSYQGMTLLGGEPMEPQNQAGLLPLLREFHSRYPEKDLWCFTGYLFDQDIIGKMLDHVPETREILSYIDVLVDGPFEIDKKDITLLYKGSSNQRTIDLKKTLKSGEIVIWDPGNNTTASKVTHL